MLLSPSCVNCWQEFHFSRKIKKKHKERSAVLI